MKLLPTGVALRVSWSAVVALRRELGLVRGLRAALATLPAQFGNRPFDVLDPPRDDREGASRKQIAPAILLYRHLKTRISRDQALEKTSNVVYAGALTFLQRIVGPIDLARFRQLDEGDRRRAAQQLMDRFFNATSQLEVLTDTQLVFTVTHCLFPELCRAVGAEELAPLFCRADLDYFNQEQSPVRLTREGTLAEGHSCCRFMFEATDSIPCSKQSSGQ